MEERQEQRQRKETEEEGMARDQEQSAGWRCDRLFCFCSTCRSPPSFPACNSNGRTKTPDALVVVSKLTRPTSLVALLIHVWAVFAITVNAWSARKG